MSDLNGPPPETAAHTATQNLKNGLVGSTGTKLRALVLLGIFAAIGLIIFMGTRKSEAEAPVAETSKVAVQAVKFEDEDKGASASNPEVDSLVAQVEQEKQVAAINDGDTYVPPVPDLDKAEPVAPVVQQTAPATPIATVSISSQQAKLAALQGLDGRLAETKYGIPSETRFEQPKTSGVAGSPPQSDAAPGENGDTPGGSSSTSNHVVSKQYPAGTIWFATTLVAIDSDVPSPIKARIEQGPYAGGTVLGSYEVTGRKYVTLSFSRIVYENVEIPIDAIGLNPNNGLAGIEGDVNNRWGQRLILPTLAAAVGKYAEAATFGGVTSITAGGSVMQQPELSSEEQLTYALGSGVQEGIEPAIQEEAKSVKRQVTLPSSTSFGLMLVTGI